MKQYMNFILFFGGSLLYLLLSYSGGIAAQTGVVWNTQFFNNPYLFGQPTVTRQDNAVSFNWGGASPITGVNNDHFTAQFSTTTSFAAGTYRFTILADDGVQLFIDDTNLVVQTFDQPRPAQTLTVDVPLSAGLHKVQLDYREFTGDAYVYLNWASVSGPTAPVVQAPIPSAPSNSTWSAEYFSNPNLSGSPIAILGESSPSHNWGTGAPLANMSVDNFSVRWRSVQYLNEGLYRINLRVDDGIKVSVNGVNHINEWHVNDGVKSYVADFRLPAGNHNFTIEYYEASGSAFIEYSLTRIDSTTPGQGNPNTNSNARMTVTSARLNVRSMPSLTSSILTQIGRNESYPIIGRNGDSSWWQVNINGTVGWVSARYTSASNIQNIGATTTTTQPNPPATTGNILTTTAHVNLRTGPAKSFNILSVVPRNTSIAILSRNHGNTWWKVSYNGTAGWVNADYIALQPTVNLSQIPFATS